jgi:hypothetical protein
VILDSLVRLKIHFPVRWRVACLWRREAGENGHQVEIQDTSGRVINERRGRERVGGRIAAGHDGGQVQLVFKLRCHRADVWPALI